MSEGDTPVRKWENGRKMACTLTPLHMWRLTLGLGRWDEGPDVSDPQTCLAGRWHPCARGSEEGKSSAERIDWVNKPLKAENEILPYLSIYIWYYTDSSPPSLPQSWRLPTSLKLPTAGSRKKKNSSVLQLHGQHGARFQLIKRLDLLHLSSLPASGR